MAPREVLGDEKNQDMACCELRATLPSWRPPLAAKSRELFELLTRLIEAEMGLSQDVAELVVAQMIPN